MISNELVRGKIRTTRERKGLSVIDMAERLHMDERSYKRIESGEKKNLDIALLDKIAELLEVDFTELFVPDTIAINTIQNNIGGFSNKDVVLNGMSEDVKAHYEKIIQELHSVIAEKQLLIEERRECFRDAEETNCKSTSLRLV